MAGTDDGNRQVAVTLGEVMLALKAGLDPVQFEALETQLGGINGAINKLAENVAAPDTSLAAEIQSLKQEVVVGFSGLQQSLANLNNTIFNMDQNLGKWLAAIALAAANPEDNTTEVQAKINEQANAVKAVKDKLQTSVDAQTKGD